MSAGYCDHGGGEGRCPHCGTVVPVRAQPEPLPCVCDGNGWVYCWKCDGDGAYLVPLDDGTDGEDYCDECRGSGGWPCQGHEYGGGE